MERIWLVCVFVYINVCTCMQNELTHVGLKKKKDLYIRWYINVCSLPKLFRSFYALNCAAESRGHSWHVTMKFCFPPQITMSQPNPPPLPLKKIVYIHIVIIFLTCGAFSIVSKATVMKFVWPISIYVHHYTGVGIFDSEICNKWCSFLTKEQYLFIVVFFTFILTVLHCLRRKTFLWLLFFLRTWCGKKIYEQHFCFLTAWPAVSCALFLRCCLRGYPGREEPAW